MRAGFGGVVRFAAIFASLLIAPWAFRVLLLAEEVGAVPATTDLRGFASDFAVACLLAVPVILLGRVARGLAVLVVLLVVLAAYVNYETVVALGSVASLLDAGFLGDQTFLRGSVAAISHPVFLGAVAGVSMGLAWWGLRSVPLRAAFGFLVAGGLAAALLVVWGQDDRVETWRQLNAIEHNVVWLSWRGLGPGSGYTDPPQAMVELLPELAGNLDAPARFPYDGAGRNVLLVMVEGVSGAYLDGPARTQGRTPVQPMERLQSHADGGLRFDTFVAHQRKTNRGSYALLCGELPGLVAGTAKMTESVHRRWRLCLPEILKDAGYRTAYLQAAPLAFMLKDRFMPEIGFEEVDGHDWFATANARSEWGVDDRAFFTQALEKIADLQRSGDPWFLTLLTVGTHHPFVVPESFEHPGDDRARAFAYLDLALDEFLGALDERGVRDDTLVLVVSDESQGDRKSGATAVTRRLSQNWGVLVALLPERVTEVVVEPYAQIDVAWSILDYLGLSDRGRHLFGRSLFRRYPEARHLFFGNVNRGEVGGVDPEGRLVICAHDGRLCKGYDVRDGRLFKPRLEREIPDADLVGLVRGMAERSRPPGREFLELPLITNPVFDLVSRGWQIVAGGQHVSLMNEDAWLEVEMVVRAEGKGRAEFQHLVRLQGVKDMRDVALAAARLRGGETLHMRYTFAADSPLRQVGLRTRARLLSREDLRLVFLKRRLTLREGSDSPPAGARFAEFEIEPRNAATRKRLRLTVAQPESYESLVMDKNAGAEAR